ncbi:host attachment protein [Novosphingobium sp. TH158]|uniref:baeRF12 domain-containing protein n=1 Tax=Novosphingobium sp. TH158 TaxID=2067455 RepID=UPI000C7E092A|nr:host attachment protein [Novosphingobium sp. TH158]PLK26040.1 attachment protein [Novosphingobium sp. TH158]
MLLSHGTVIVLVDGRGLELYRNAGDEAGPELAAMPAPKLDSRNHSGAGHHSSAGNHADSQVGEDAHANAVAQWLNAEVLGHRIEQLVVIAPPRTLGELRRHFHKQTEKAIARELAKDLMGAKPPQVLAALREVH